MFFVVMVTFHLGLMKKIKSLNDISVGPNYSFCFLHLHSSTNVTDTVTNEVIIEGQYSCFD